MLLESALLLRAFTYINSRVVTPLDAFWVTVGVSVLKNT